MNAQMPGDRGNFLESVRRSGTEKWHIHNNFIRKKHLVSSNVPGMGKIHFYAQMFGSVLWVGVVKVGTEQDIRCHTSDILVNLRAG